MIDHSFIIDEQMNESFRRPYVTHQFRGEKCALSYCPCNASQKKSTDMMFYENKTYANFNRNKSEIKF